MDTAEFTLIKDLLLLQGFSVEQEFSATYECPALYVRRDNRFHIIPQIRSFDEEAKRVGITEEFKKETQ